jgi:glycosyltransferase involved in cell wall biosynthesis
MEKINILHVYQNSKVGGIQQQILNIMKGYDRNVFRPVFCCLGPKKEMGEEIEKLGFNSIALNRVRYHRFSPGIIPDIYRIIKKERIHIVRTHKYRANLYGRIAGWLANAPVIIASLHIDYGNKDEYFGRKMANRMLARITDTIIAVSDSVKNDSVRYDRIDPSRIIVIHNGVDTLAFNPEGTFRDISKDLSIEKEDMVIGCVGRIVHSKGLSYLLEALPEILHRYRSVKLLIVGDGSLKEDLREQARRLRILDRVIFAGRRRDIPDILSRMNVFVIPSIKEGLPNAILEAMAMGKPVVATNVGGIPEVVQHGVSGLIVPPRDVERIARSVITLIDEPGKAKNMGEKARGFIMEQYSMQSTVQKWQTLYLTLLERKGVRISDRVVHSNL